MTYISYNNIGTSGQMGSQIQQFASLYAIAKENNKKLIFSKSAASLSYGLKFAKLLDIDIEYREDEFFEDFITYQLFDNYPDQGVFQLDPEKNYNFIGLFHLYTFWHPKYEKEIFDIPFRKEHYNRALERYHDLGLDKKETVSIHSRREDYLDIDAFCELTYENYYKEAINYFTENYDNPFFVSFSLHPEWVKQELPLLNNSNSLILDHGVDFEDIILMSLCNHNIIANSTFSWWAAFKNKNPNKQIICPTNYMNPEFHSYSFLNGNYYPPTWKNINNIK